MNLKKYNYKQFYQQVLKNSITNEFVDEYFKNHYQ